MKKLIIILFAVILLTACNERYSKSGQLAQKQQIESNQTVKVKVIGLTSKFLDEGIIMYEHKAIKADSTIVFIKTNHVFDYGEILVVKKSQLLNP